MHVIQGMMNDKPLWSTLSLSSRRVCGHVCQEILRNSKGSECSLLDILTDLSCSQAQVYVFLRQDHNVRIRGVRWPFPSTTLTRVKDVS